MKNSEGIERQKREHLGSSPPGPGRWRRTGCSVLCVRIRPLAVASSKRHPQLPDVPTAAEAGLPGYEVIAWMGLVAPRGTPADVVKRLNQELVKALQTKEVRDALFNQGLHPASNSPEEFSAFIAAESARWSRAVKASGAKVD